MIKLLLLVCISLSSMNSLRISELAKKTLSEKYHVRWAEWKEKYYPGEGEFTEVDNEESLKKFEANNKEIDEFNANKEKNGYTFDEACNKFCCKSSEDMVAYEGLKVHDHKEDLPENHLLREKNLALEDMMNKPNFTYKVLPEATADEVNHISLGNDVTPKNQGKCGSCWAFATISSIESAFKIGGGDLLNLSEQQLVDCDTSNNGCDGGFMDDAIDWVSKNGVIKTSDYPYTEKDGACQGSADKYVKGYKVNSYSKVPAYDERQLAAAVQRQPVTAAVDASKWHLYDGGVFNSYIYCYRRPNHAVTIVGYGKTSWRERYWIVKNSWGTNWGEGGYIRVRKDSGYFDGMCGIALHPYYPNVTVTAEPSGDDSEEDQTGPVDPEDEDREPVPETPSEEDEDDNKPFPVAPSESDTDEDRKPFPVAPSESDDDGPDGPVAPKDPKCKDCTEVNWHESFQCVICKLDHAFKVKNLNMGDEELKSLSQDLYKMRNNIN